MGFISYSLNYYSTQLREIESCAVTGETLCLARRLLKMLDDLADEGYLELNEKLETHCRGVSRLREYLRVNNAEPFKLRGKAIAESDAVYGTENWELTDAVKALAENAARSGNASKDEFITKLIRFCDWVKYEKGTAYIFLLRDTLLPYIYYQNKNRANIYPWLLGRKTLASLTGEENADDEIRASIIMALEHGGCHNFDEFAAFVIPRVKATLAKYPQAENCLRELMRGISGKRVVVIEAGCSGTFPMLLMSLDARVEVRMYTTYPYLLGIYADRIFTPKYEENRLFETLYAQDLYFRFSALRDGRFYVNKCKSAAVEEQALAEVKGILR